MNRSASRKSARRALKIQSRFGSRGSARRNPPSHRRPVLEALEDRRLLAAGDLDPTFGDGGLVTTDIGDVTDDRASDVAMVAQPDGKILVAGYVSHWSWSSRTDFLVMRYNSDGSLDTSFGVEGVARVDFGSHWEGADALAVDGEGRIIVAGFSQQGYQHDFAVARLTADGNLDTSFAGDGKFLYDFAGFSDQVNDVAIDAAGGIVLAGMTRETGISGYRNDMALVRLDSTGALDTSFNGTGVLQMDFGGSSDIANAVLIDASGRILLAGSAYDETARENDFMVVRLTDQGGLDSDFDGDGIQEIDFTAGSNDSAYDLTLDSGGKIVVTGGSFDQASGSYTDFAVARLTDTGSLDTSFDGDGKQTLDFDGNYDFAYNVGLDSAGRVVLMGGSFGSVNAARLLADGSLDLSFGDAGRQTLDFGSGRGQFGAGLVDGQDRVLIVGQTYRTSADIGLARLDADGALDATFGEGGFVATDIGIDGTTDAGWDVVATQPDGKILVAGTFRVQHSNSYSDFAVVRYNPDGSLDTSFGTDGISRIQFGYWPAEARGIAVDSQGRIVVAGYARWSSSYNSDFVVTRLTPTGEIDGSFNSYGVFHQYYYRGRQLVDFGSNYDEAYAVAVDADDNVVLVGRTLEDPADGRYNFAVARLTDRGLIDYDFGERGKVTIDMSGAAAPGGSDAAYDVAIDAAGRIVVAGQSYQGSSSGADMAVARLDSAGALDTSFGAAGKQVVDFGGQWESANGMALDAGGRIVLAGYSTETDVPWDTDFAAARLDANGQIDTSFGMNGTQTAGLADRYENGRDVAIDGSGTIVVAGNAWQSGTGSDFAVVKFAPNGELVTSFGDDGWASADFGHTSETANAVALDGQDRIVAVGTSYQGWPSYNDFAVARYLNAGPNITGIGVSSSLAATGNTISADAEFFYNANKVSSHTALWDWGDGATSAGSVTESGGVGAATGSHSYSSAGVYTITVTVTDNLAESGSATSQFVVVYDPDAGFVTGGGWFDSPQGAYVPSQWQTGKANFGFVAKYENGATVPTGQTQFRFDGLKFHSTQYEWLVIDGPTAQYQGSGTINGDGDYAFRLTVLDGQVGGGEDAIRIKIWDKASNTVVYDNQPGAAQNNDPTTLLGGGSLVIHDGGEALHAAGKTSASAVGANLTQAALAPVVEQAMAYWAGQGVGSQRLAALHAIDVHVADLAPSVLGVASSSNLIWIDRDAAGYGWSVAPAAASGSASGSMDLLSVVTHEFGHKLGFEHGDVHNVMGARLAPGVQTLDVSASFPESPYGGQRSLLSGLDSIALSRDSWQRSSRAVTSLHTFPTERVPSDDLEALGLRDEFFGALAHDAETAFDVEGQLHQALEGDIVTDALGRDASLDTITESLLDEDLLEDLDAAI